MENWQLTETFIWCTIALKWSLKKVNKSWYVALLIFVFSGSIKKLSSVDCVNIYLFTTFFSRFCPVEKAFLNKFMLMTAFAEWLVNRQNKSNGDHCQKFVPSPITETPQAGFEPAQNRSFVYRWFCLMKLYRVGITTGPTFRRLCCFFSSSFRLKAVGLPYIADIGIY